MSTAEPQIGVNTNLQKQDLKNLDVTNLTALSPEVISRQATINIGTIGHVAHGKSTVVKAISGVQTVRFKNELERNITIKLERISKQRLQAMLESPQLLRNYEERVDTRLKQLAQLRQDVIRRLRSTSMSYGSPLLRGASNVHKQMSRSMSLESVITQRTSTRLRHFAALRQDTSSPSSGYETLTDNASSICSLDNFAKSKSPSPQDTIRHRSKSLSRSSISSAVSPTNLARTAIKRRLSNAKSAVSSSDSDNKTYAPKKTAKKASGEYIVEDIQSMESINGKPVFFVKWLNYSTEHNTWEELENLLECAALEQFIEKRSALFDLTIAAICADIEAEIERDGLTYDASNLTMAKLDEFEPLILKADLILLAHFRDSGSRQQKEPEKIRKRVIDMMLLKPYYYMRKRQQMELSAWQKYVNDIELTAPIKIENHVDLDVPDPSFTYILESFAAEGSGIDTATDPPIGCKCEESICVPTKTCCARMADGYFAYEKNGRLRIRTGEAIYECNSKCMCDQTCRNRVIQHGRKNTLTIFKTANNCGWGVRTERALRKGEYVCEYVGEIITSEEANERGKRYDDIGRTYLFDLDYNTTSESVYTIDAALYGNVSHFLNHSCDPNLAVFPFWINNLDVNMPRLAFFSLRPIKAGEELTFDYIRPSANENDANGYQNLSDAKKITCRCGAENCRKVLF